MKNSVVWGWGKKKKKQEDQEKEKEGKIGRRIHSLRKIQDGGYLGE